MRRVATNCGEASSFPHSSSSQRMSMPTWWSWREMCDWQRIWWRLNASQVNLPQRQADLLSQIAQPRRFELVQASRW